MAEGYDPTVERERAEVAVDEDLGGGETRRYYVKTATQADELVAISVEAAPGTFLTWDDLDDAIPEAKKLAKLPNGRRKRRKA
jgi:hypothetical protein